MTSKGQVTIPVNVRYQLGIGPGDDIVFSVEEGRGVFRRAVGLGARAGALGLPVADDAHPLVRFLCVHEPAFVQQLAGGARIAVDDAVMLGLVEALLGQGTDGSGFEVLLDVLADRRLLFEHARALRAAVDAARMGTDPLLAYAVEKGQAPSDPSLT